MSELEVSERAYEAGERAAGELNPRIASFRLQLDTAVEASAPIIVAAELRRQADDLHELRQTIREEVGRSIRSSAMTEGISRLRKRANELDPDGMTW
jgi:hypothetical protein